MRFDERDPAEAERRASARSDEIPNRRDEGARHDAVLRLQRLVGNNAVTALISRSELQRDPAPAKPPAKEKEEQAGAGYVMTASGIGSFELESFSWGAGTGGPGGAEKEPPKEMTCTKRADDHTPKLMQHAADGRKIDTVTIVLRKGGKPFLTYTLKGVFITSFQTGGSSGDQKPLETFSLTATEIEFEYSPDGEQSAGGSQDGGSSESRSPG